MLAGLVERERLALPWDIDPAAGRFRESVEEPDFARKILEARRAEAAEKQYDRAAGIYLELIDAAHSDSQRVKPRSLLAVTLARSGAEAEALGLRRDLLNLPSSVVDEHVCRSPTLPP